MIKTGRRSGVDDSAALSTCCGTGTNGRSLAAPARNIRYKAIAVGNAQNLLVRFILSNLGQESLGQNHWEDTKSYFGGKCAYCGEAKELHMDHGIPINKTCLGEHRLGNLIPSCKKCNDDKHYADFKEFLEDKIERIVKIEAYMASKGYTPLGDNKHIKMIVDGFCTKFR